LIRWDGSLLGVIGFGAAAWKVAARDDWIGWDRRTREARSGRVLNNARFLLLPWVRVNLKRVVERSSGCVPRGGWQGTTTRNSHFYSEEL
jgi:hypothetical protein